MKHLFCLFVLLPLFLSAQLKRNKVENIYKLPKIGLSLNVLSIFDTRLPTIQPGVIIKVSPRLVNSIDFGVPFNYARDKVDSIPTWFTHFKVKNSLLYHIPKFKMHAGVLLFYTQVHRFETHGWFRDGSPNNMFYKGEWKKNIFGYGLKGEFILPVQGHFWVVFSGAIGQRFVNASLSAQSVYQKTVHDGLFIIPEQVGKFNTIYFELGAKACYFF